MSSYSQKMTLKLYFVFVSLYLLKTVGCFDITLDTRKEVRGWKIHGNYANSSSSLEIRQLRPHVVLHLAPTSTSASKGGRGSRARGGNTTREFEREGIWLFKHEPEGGNKWNMTTSMTHLLFAQGWVTMLVHPNVEVIFKTSGDDVVGRFWSDGKSWCDAVFSVGLHSMFAIEVSTPKAGEYALIDKVVLGIMGNITALKKKRIDNPCLTTPMTDNTLPDMEQKPQIANELKRRVPDTIVTPPDMEDKTNTATVHRNPSTTPPMGVQSPVTPVTKTYQTERGGAKCDCICTCARPTSNTTVVNPTPTTMTTAPTRF